MTFVWTQNEHKKLVLRESTACNKHVLQVCLFSANEEFKCSRQLDKIIIIIMISRPWPHETSSRLQASEIRLQTARTAWLSSPRIGTREAEAASGFGGCSPVEQRPRAQNVPDIKISDALNQMWKSSLFISHFPQIQNTLKKSTFIFTLFILTVSELWEGKT